MRDNTVTLRIFTDPNNKSVFKKIRCTNLATADACWCWSYKQFDAEVVRTSKPGLPIARMKAIK